MYQFLVACVAPAKQIATTATKKQKNNNKQRIYNNKEETEKKSRDFHRFFIDCKFT